MQITRDDDRGGAVLNCAVRYALGRGTYMPNLVMDEIRPMLKDCNDKTLHVFNKDIKGWLDDCDRLEGSSIRVDYYRSDWARFRKAVLKELKRRGY